MASATCRTLCVGKLTAEVVAQKPMSEPDGQGGFLPTQWVEYFTFWASVKWTKGWEKTNAGKLQAYNICKMEMAYDKRMDETLRLVFNGKTLNIRTVSDWEERHYIMDVMAEDGVGS